MKNWFPQVSVTNWILNASVADWVSKVSRKRALKGCSGDFTCLRRFIDLCSLHMCPFSAFKGFQRPSKLLEGFDEGSVPKGSESLLQGTWGRLKKPTELGALMIGVKVRCWGDWGDSRNMVGRVLVRTL